MKFSPFDVVLLSNSISIFRSIPICIKPIAGIGLLVNFFVITLMFERLSAVYYFDI